MLDKVYRQIHSENGRPSSVWVWVGVGVCVRQCVYASAQSFIKWCCWTVKQYAKALLGFQKLEEEFFRQKEEQEKFYGASQQGEGEAPNMSHLYSASSASLRSKDSAGSMSSRHSTVI